MLFWLSQDTPQPLFLGFSVRFISLVLLLPLAGFVDIDEVPPFLQPWFRGHLGQVIWTT